MTKTFSNMAAFIRSLPLGMSYENALKQKRDLTNHLRGQPLSRHYWSKHRVRSLPALAKEAVQKPSTAEVQPMLRLVSSEPHEQHVLDAVDSLGLRRVREVVDAVEKLYGCLVLGAPTVDDSKMPRRDDVWAHPDNEAVRVRIRTVTGGRVYFAFLHGAKMHSSTKTADFLLRFKRIIVNG